jgi:hypothetical protein
MREASSFIRLVAWKNSLLASLATRNLNTTDEKHKASGDAEVCAAILRTARTKKLT